MKLEIDMKVRVLPFAGYDDRFVGEIGLVKRTNTFVSGGTIGVKLEKHTNSASSYGVYWFKQNKLEIIEEIESEDEKIMLENYKVAGISFLEGTNTKSVYAYALYDENINVDDIVVVQSGHHGLGIAKVVSINSEEFDAKSVQCGREIITKVDFTAYEERKSKAEKIKSLKKQMDAKVKELQNQAIYEMLAEKDPALKTMLDEYKNLLNG